LKYDFTPLLSSFSSSAQDDDISFQAIYTGIITTDSTMKLSIAVAALTMGFGAQAFTSPSGATAPRVYTHMHSAVEDSVAEKKADGGKTQDPLLIRAAKGEKVERTPVWMMRQAGRHIKEYRDLCKKWPTFRQRSEIPEVAVEVSLQPWRNYQTDGCILFSDILTPLPGVGCDFTIDEKLGPIMDPIKNWDDAKKVRFY
jgi:uroporphyrinogen decarboxylase